MDCVAIATSVAYYCLYEVALVMCGALSVRIWEAQCPIPNNQQTQRWAISNQQAFWTGEFRGEWINVYYSRWYGSFFAISFFSWMPMGDSCICPAARIADELSRKGQKGEPPSLKATVVEEAEKELWVVTGEWFNWGRNSCRPAGGCNWVFIRHWCE